MFVAYSMYRGMQSSTLKSYISAIRFILNLDGHQWSDDKALLLTLTKSCRYTNDKAKNKTSNQKTVA